MRSVQKRQNQTLKICVFTFFSDNSGCLFLHRPHEMSFYSENLHECEELVYICTQFFSDFFFHVLLFFEFREKKGCR